MEIYSALKAGFTTARHQLADAREQARLAAARREKSREDAQAEAVRVLAQLNAQLEEALDARAEREAEAHHATSDVFQDVISVEPSGGKAAEHLATVIWLHGMGETGDDWRRQLVHAVGKGQCAPLPLLLVLLLLYLRLAGADSSGALVVAGT